MSLRLLKRRSKFICCGACCLLSLCLLIIIQVWWKEKGDLTNRSGLQFYGNGPVEILDDSSLSTLEDDFAVINSKHEQHKPISEATAAWKLSSLITPMKGFALKSMILKEDLFSKAVEERKYLFVIGHYEQLGRTTINYIDAASLATRCDRHIVAPFVRNSRYTGLPGGWFGVQRTGARAYIPWEQYFDVSSFQKLFKSLSLNPIVSLDHFKRDCSLSSGKEITLVYFLYAKDELTTRKYIHLADEQFHILENNTKKTGWVECRVLNKELMLHKRIGNVSVGRQLCVDPEKITEIDVLKNDILKGDQCVAFVYWKGVGEKRTHFNVSLYKEPSDLLRFIEPSSLIENEVRRFIDTHLKGDFIGVHLRLERILRWNGMKTLNKCIRTAQRFLKTYSVKYPNIFVADDLNLYGSDTMSSVVNVSVMEQVRADITAMIKTHNAKIYSIRKARDPYWTDSGVVALVQMHILARAKHLITVGDGTFQSWIVETFRRQKKVLGNKNWRIVRCCASLQQTPKPPSIPADIHKLQAKGNTPQE